MEHKRFDDIDTIRAIAVIGMIITHILATQLGTVGINTVWNYLHFVVPLFIYCAGYVTNEQAVMANPLAWVLRRSKRIILPYYLFTALHYFLWYLFPSVFGGTGLSLSIPFIIKTIAFIGVDYSWLVLLMLELTILTPLIYRFKYSIIPIILSIIFSLITLVFSWPIDYRFIMWIPWMGILFLGIRLREHPPTIRQVLTVGTLSACIHIFLHIVFTTRAIPTTLTLHKYPPDMYYLSYGIAVGAFLTAALSRISSLHPAVRWISRHSYDLFFIHYIILDGIRSVSR